MAGSYRHVTRKIRSQGEKRQFIGPTLLDHLGDATEALEELWFMAHFLAGDDPAKLDAALAQFYNPTDPLAVDLRQRQEAARENGYWRGRLDAEAIDENE